jgi:hypothetical protein
VPHGLFVELIFAARCELRGVPGISRHPLFTCARPLIILMSALLAMLRGAGLVTAQETEDGHHWAESKIKALTGGDPVSARFMRQDFFTYQPSFKLIVAGNHRPSLRNVDEAIRRRFTWSPSP